MAKRKTKKKPLKIDGYTFKGNFEPEVYKRLKELKRKFKSFSIEYETEKIPYTRVTKGNYWPDFPIKKKDGSVFYIEAKGYLRPFDVVKLISVKTLYPDIDLRLVFQRNNKMSGRKNLTYCDWAQKHGFKCAVETVPEEWFEE